MTASACVLGIFVGGRGSRMGGVNKALLQAPGGQETLIERAVRIGREAGLEVVIVGDGDVGAALADVPRLRDEPEGIGPLGGLGALLAYAQSKHAVTIALACDMPYVTSALLEKVSQASSNAAVLCPRDAGSGKWQTLFARYEPARALAAIAATLSAGRRSLQAALEHAGCEELRLSVAEHEQLRDWDAPGDVER